MGGQVNPECDLSKCVYTDRYYAYQEQLYKQKPPHPEILVREIWGGDFLGGFTYKAVEEVETGRRFTGFIAHFRPLNAMEVLAWASK